MHQQAKKHPVDCKEGSMPQWYGKEPTIKYEVIDIFAVEREKNKNGSVT